MKNILFFDGSSEPNPGKMGIGFKLETSKGTISKSYRLEGEGTSNIAEWCALIYGLELAISEGIDELLVKGDSNLVIHQIVGDYKTRDPKLIPLKNRAVELVQKISKIKFKHISRDENSDADYLASQSHNNLNCIVLPVPTRPESQKNLFDY